MTTTERDLSEVTDVIEQQQHHLSVATVSNSAISSKTASVASNADYEKQNYSDADVTESEKSGSESDDKKQTSEKVAFRQLFRFATPLDKLYMVVGIFAACISGASMPVMSIIFAEILGQFIDFASGKSPSTDHLTDEVRKYVLYFVAIGVGVWVFAYLQTVTWMVAGERQAKRVRETYYGAILRQDISYFDSAGSTGNVLNRISGDISIFQEGISEKVTLLVQYVATFVAGFIVAYAKGWKLSLVLTAVIPLLIFAAAAMARALASQSSQGQDAYAAAASVAEQALSGIRTVVAFGGQEREIARYVKRLDSAYKVGHKKALAQGFGMASIMLIIFGTYALGFYYGGKLIVDGTMDPSQVLNVFLSIFIGAFSLGNAAPNVSAVSEAMGAAANLFAVIDRVPPIDTESGTGYELRKQDVKGRIEFRHIKFHYPTRPDVPILKDFSLTVEPGETVALVGSSGSGKSTCVGLLERFYDPIEGEVLLDGVNIKDISVKSLRSHIGLVGQEPVLFPTTVSENIKWGGVFNENPPTLDNVKEACRKANAHEFIEDLPETYDTDVGEKGSLLSGGQKQRIAIARAIIKNPAILLLDEATSALDTESERLVQEALDAASSGRTTIVIAHRLSTIKNADKIVVMSGGEILEVGRHDELISMQGVYHGLVKAQELKMKKDDDESDSDGADGTRSDEVTVQIDSTARQRPMRRMSTYASVAKSVEEIREEDDERAKEKPMPLLRVLNLNKPELKMVCFGILGAAVNGAIMPMFAFIFSKILEVFARTDLDYMREGVNFWSGMFGVIGIVAFCANVLQQGLFVLSGERLTRRIRTMTFTALMKQEIGFFDDENNATGVLTSKLAVDASRVEGLAGSLMGSIVQNIASVCVGLTIAFLHGWKLTLVVMAASPAIILAGALQMKALSGYGGKTRKAYDKSGQIVQQSVSNMRTIISLVREDTFRTMYNEAIRHPHLVAVKGFFVSSIGFGASQGLLFFVYALAFWYGGKLVTNYEYSVKDMQNVLFAIIFTSISLGQFSTFAPNTAKAKIAAVNIFEVLDRRPMIDTYDTEGKERPAPVTGEARVFNGRFAYPARKDVTVLRGLDVDIKPGQTVALVGGSGSGKSTIVSLLLRFYDLLRGTVEVERRSLDRWDVSYLRSNMALVGQEPVLFDLTIAENIAYGKEGASQEEVETAARAANIHNFISKLPKGYDTPVGEKGTQLSGGQKQRIAIARAVIRQPKILLLDEATSALDTESEKVVQDALDKASTGRTTVTIAHRLSTIQNADVIYVIKKGRVAEVGKHMELIAKKGLYHDLVSKQMLNKTSS